MAEKKKRKGERADGSFQAFLELRPAPDGKRRRKVFYGKSRAEALKRRDDYLREEGHELPRTERYTVRQWAEVWMRTYVQDKRAKTIEYYAAALKNQIYPAIGDMYIDEIKPMDIRTIYQSVADSSQSLIDRTKVTTKQVFATALDNECIKRDPTRNIKPPKGKKGTHRALEPWEIELIDSYAMEHRCGIWVMLMLYAGLRRGEMAALEWNDIDMQRQAIRVERAYSWVDNIPLLEENETDTKTVGGRREIPIAPPLHEAIMLARKKGANGPVCVPARGGLMTQTAVRKGLESLLHSLNKHMADEDERRTAFTSHDLRHTYATMLYDAGVDVLTAAKWLGHSDVATTMRIYTHLSEQRQKAATGKWLEYWHKDGQ